MARRASFASATISPIAPPVRTPIPPPLSAAAAATRLATPSLVSPVIVGTPPQASIEVSPPFRRHYRDPRLLRRGDSPARHPPPPVKESLRNAVFNGQ